MQRSCESITTAICCRNVGKHFYYYDHRLASLREVFIRRLRRQPEEKKDPHFTIEDFNLTVARGESVALIGANGSGKSTILRLLAGIYVPSHGEIVIEGRVAAVIELGAGFHPDLTGAENIEIYGTVMGLTRAEIRGKYEDIVAFAGLHEFIEVPVKYYSSGMQARLAFAVTVCIEPDILLLDEVLAVGDQEFRAKCFKRLVELHRAGRTLVIATHDLDSASRFCSRAVWIEKGRIRMEADIDTVRKAYEGGVTT